ncbi:MAG: acyltransferase, partial [Asticcacaulis sp.]|nr:acyltransferase [Asticcacaulis sp.]
GPMAAKFHATGWNLGFNGRFGVDIFFVISGFIMCWIGLKAFGERNGPRNFIVDRVTRIVPLYWACTLALVLVTLALAHFGNPDATDRIDFGVAKSLFFIPYLNDAGKHRPFLGQGWTLDHEMMFYAVFAACLFLKRLWGIIAMVVAFAAIYIAGMLPGAPHVVKIWGDPIIFEFLVGFGLCLLYQRYKISLVLPFAWVVPLIAIGLATAVFGDRPELELARALTAIGIVAFAVFSVDPKPIPIIEQTLEKLGNASYSLYLTHGFVLLFVGIAWRKVFHGHYLPLYALVNIALALPLGYLVHVWCELPMTRAARMLALKLGLTERVTSPVPPVDDQPVKPPRKRRRMAIF